MVDSYFGNLRKVGITIDEGISKLQDTWNMPHVLLCNSNDETQNIAKKLIDDLKTELTQIRVDIGESQKFIIPLQESSTQELDEKTEEVDILKKELDEIKVLFLENGYVEEESSESDISALNNQLDTLSFNNSNSFIKNISDLTHSSTFDSNCLNDSVTRHSINSKTPIKNVSCNDKRKAALLNEPPMEPIYSPCFYKIIKK